jgi:hypothetical protein
MVGVDGGITGSGNSTEGEERIRRGASVAEMEQEARSGLLLLAEFITRHQFRVLMDIPENRIEPQFFEPCVGVIVVASRPEPRPLLVPDQDLRGNHPLRISQDVALIDLLIVDCLTDVLVFVIMSDWGIAPLAAVSGIVPSAMVKTLIPNNLILFNQSKFDLSRHKG